MSSDRTGRGERRTRRSSGRSSHSDGRGSQSEDREGRSGGRRSRRRKRGSSGSFRWGRFLLIVLVAIGFVAIGTLFALLTRWQTFVTPYVPETHTSLAVEYPAGWQHHLTGGDQGGPVAVAFAHTPPTGIQRFLLRYVLRKDLAFWNQDSLVITFHSRNRAVNIDEMAKMVERDYVHGAGDFTMRRYQHPMGTAIEVESDRVNDLGVVAVTLRHLWLFPDTTSEVQPFYIEAECKGIPRESERLQPVFTEMLKRIRLLEGR